VELTRPFSQLNFAASDFDSAKEAGIEYTKAAVTVDAYPSLNLISGAATGDLTSVTFASTAFPATETFPNSDTSDETEYKYLSMNYFLVYQDASSTLDKAVLTLANDNESQSFEYTNVPVQKNYRTNVYGALLTNDYKISLSLNAAYKGAYNKFTEVSTADELTKALAAGESVTLTDDIEVESLSITSSEEEPVQINLGSSTLTVKEATDFKGDITISGASVASRAGETITGRLVNETLTVTDTNNPPAFVVSPNATVTFENVEIYVPNATALYISPSCTATLRNCKVQSNKTFAIGTNASNPYFATLTIEDTEVIGNTAMLLNVPLTATIKNSTFKGARQGVILRGGTYNIQNSKFYLDLNGRRAALLAEKSTYTVDPQPSPRISVAWGSGNYVPLGALVIGNRSTGAYQYATTFNGTLEDSYALIIPETDESPLCTVADYSNVYIYANQTENIGVYFNFSADKLIKTTDETYTEAGKPIVYGSANIFVNGVEQEANQSTFTWK
jgi:hypothetical protein